MESIQSIEQSLRRNQSNKKILLIGNSNSGKLQLFNMWVNRPSSIHSDQYNNEEFCTIPISSEKNKFNLEIWNIPETKDKFSTSFTSSELIIVVLYANYNHKDKLNQLLNWLDVLQTYKLNHIPLAIVETTSDLDYTSISTNLDIGEMKNKFVFHQIFSFKASDDSLSQLNKQIISLFSINNIQPMPQITSLPPTDVPNDIVKQEIIDLPAEIRKGLLQSLKCLLLLGPINEAAHHYELRFFRGVELTLNGNNFGYKVPFNVFNWLVKINTALYLPSEYNTSTFIDIFETLAVMNEQKPWDRSPSTHDFYKNSLFNFIKYVVLSHNRKDEELNYYTMRRKISELHRNSVNNIISWLSDYIIAGPFPNRETHYDLGLFGGKTFSSSTATRSAKVASHAAALLNFLSNIDQTKDNQLSLMIALDYTITIGYSRSSDRKETTQVFYNQLTSALINKIDEEHKQSYQKRQSFGMSH